MRFSRTTVDFLSNDPYESKKLLQKREKTTSGNFFSLIGFLRTHATFGESVILLGACSLGAPEWFCHVSLPTAYHSRGFIKSPRRAFG